MKKTSTSKAILLIALVLVSGTFSFAQPKEKHTLNSQVLNEKRVISVFTPSDYQNSENAYPVVYLLDGKTHFQHATGAVNFLTGQGKIPETIIVAIHNVDRTRDFSPIHIEKWPTTGGADKFLDFVVKELKPFMSENYRTAGFDILVGHSFGGAFAVHTLLNKPETFDAYVAISPYLMYADNYLVNEAKNALKPAYDEQKYFYMTVGDEPKYFEALDTFTKLVKTNCGEAITFEYNKMTDEDHGSIPYLSLYKGMQYTFSDWQLSKKTFVAGLDAIDNHYLEISEKFGIKTHTPEMVINKLGYYLMGEKKLDKAIAVFTENVKRHPKSANVYDSLGEAYENNDQADIAAKYYKKACMIGKDVNDKNLMVYKKNFQRVSEKLAEAEK